MWRFPALFALYLPVIYATVLPTQARFVLCTLMGYDDYFFCEEIELPMFAILMNERNLRCYLFLELDFAACNVRELRGAQTLVGTLRVHHVYSRYIFHISTSQLSLSRQSNNTPCRQYITSPRP